MKQKLILIAGAILLVALAISGTYSVIKSNDNQPKIAAQAQSHYQFTLKFSNGDTYQADNFGNSQINGYINVVQGQGSSSKVIAIEKGQNLDAIIPNQ